jgi:hypothetical protein
LEPCSASVFEVASKKGTVIGNKDQGEVTRDGGSKKRQNTEGSCTVSQQIPSKRCYVYRRHISEDTNFHNDCRENLKPLDLHGAQEKYWSVVEQKAPECFSVSDRFPLNSGNCTENAPTPEERGLATSS